MATSKTKETSAAPEAVDMDKVRAELDAEVQKILEMAKEEAAEIVAGAKKAKEEDIPVETTAQKAERERMKEMVEIKLFKDNDRYQDDLFVGYNGTGYIVKRGIPVKVPRAVAQIISDSEAQQDAAVSMITELTEDFKTKDRELSK